MALFTCYILTFDAECKDTVKKLCDASFYADD